jgi:hypothetical protein
MCGAAPQSGDFALFEMLDQHVCTSVVFWLGFWFWLGHLGAALGRFFRLPGRGGGGCLGGPSTTWGGRGRPAGHTAVPLAVPR